MLMWAVCVMTGGVFKLVSVSSLRCMCCCKEGLGQPSTAKALAHTQAPAPAHLCRRHLSDETMWQWRDGGGIVERATGRVLGHDPQGGVQVR